MLRAVKYRKFEIKCLPSHMHKNKLFASTIHNEEVDFNPACKQAEIKRATEPSQRTA